MPEKIYKLQPNRTIHLRGFDDLGAAAAMHSATANSFKVSGVFRDAADFAVLIVHDADNFFDHPRIRYLPDFDFDGLTLEFDVKYTGLMPLDSPKYPTIDWPFLDVILANGSSTRIRLFDHATQVSGQYTKATGSFTVVANNVKQYDRLVLWYLNYAYEYLVPQVECSFMILGAGEGTMHWVDVGGVRYETAETGSDTNTSITARLVSLMGASSKVSAAQRAGNWIDIRNKVDDGSNYDVSSSAGDSHTLYGVGKNTVAANLAAQINSANYGGGLFGLTATASGDTIHIEVDRPGVDGNFVTMYAVAKNSSLTAAQNEVRFNGGSSDATWRVRLNFAALGITQIRQMWLTFAPQLEYGAAIGDVNWDAEFTNWTLTGPEAKRILKVAGPDSVRIEDDDSWCTYTGNWGVEQGFFSGGYAKRASVVGDTVTVRYSCAVTHDLYLGTSLYLDRGVAGIRLDGDSETDLNCSLYLPSDTDAQQVNTRRRIRASVPPGEHVAVIRLKSSGFLYFDFLEAAAVSDVPDALPAVPHMSPALDYSTDHTYKLPPARVMWNFDKLGFAGPMNVYLGVFWWNQRRRVEAAVPSSYVRFEGGFIAGDKAFIELGGQILGKSVLGGETNDVIASHFAHLINGTLVGVYAEASGNTLSIFSRSPKPAYSFSLSARVEVQPGSTGFVNHGGPLTSAATGRWDVDPTQSPKLNRGARMWFADLFYEAAARGREVTVASSMELVNAPLEFAARYPDGQPVETDVGFGALKSTHCAFSSPMRSFQAELFPELAWMMAAAGLVPNVQFGEFLWWFFTSWRPANPDGGMAFYDAETASAAVTALGRPLHIFRGPNDDPSVNGGADAAFLRARLRDYVAVLAAAVRAAQPSAKCELLFPYDVNHPVPAGIHVLGGALNRFVNFPVEWESKATSGLDRIKMEALDFGAWNRDLDLARTAIEFPLLLGWPRDSLRYLVPVFRPKCAWRKEYLLARGLRVPILNFWAFDHFCLFNLDPREPRNTFRVIAG
jgi:hypothetical protein